MVLAFVAWLACPMVTAACQHINTIRIGDNAIQTNPRCFFIVFMLFIVFWLYYQLLVHYILIYFIAEVNASNYQTNKGNQHGVPQASQWIAVGV